MRKLPARNSVSRAMHRSVVLTATLLSGLLAGCGGEDQPNQQTQQIQKPKGSDSKPVGFAPPRVEPKPEEPETIDLSGVEPDQLYEMADEPPPNFVATGPAPPRPQDQFAVRRPAAGADTTRFTAAVASGGGQITASLPQGFAAVESAPVNQGWPTQIVCQLDGTRMNLIPGGDAFVGTDSGPAHCRPRVSIPVDFYYISEREVTVAQYEKFRISHGAKTGIEFQEPLNKQSPANHPALGITWRDAKAYAEWSGRMLPTEAQWEKAARGVQAHEHPWGNTRPLWRQPRSLTQIDPVGTHPDDRSPYGVLDMAGNAKEWVVDFYREDSHSSVDGLNAQRRRNYAGPRTPSQTGQRVVKGNGPSWVVWARQGVRMSDRVPNVGFRCVLSVASAAEAG